MAWNEDLKGLAVQELAIGLKLAVSATALVALLSLTWTKNKQTLHIFWGIFCGSVAIATFREAFGDSLGSYQYLIGMGACATCNAYWLVSRALFRDGKAFTGIHLLLAAVVSLLLIGRESLYFAEAHGWIGAATLSSLNGGLVEFLTLFGSAVLVLIIREGVVGWHALERKQRVDRVLFLASIGSCILICTIADGFIAGASRFLAVQSCVESVAGLTVIGTTCLLIHRRTRRLATAAGSNNSLDSDKEDAKRFTQEDGKLAGAVESLIQTQSLYLEPELKVMDVAEHLGVPEYRVSRAITGPLGQKNFNRFINHYRINHAKRLLGDGSNANWPILVVALESGFASIGPFNRAFKESVGMTPSAYRTELIGNRPSTEQILA